MFISTERMIHFHTPGTLQKVSRLKSKQKPMQTLLRRHSLTTSIATSSVLLMDRGSRRANWSEFNISMGYHLRRQIPL